MSSMDQTALALSMVCTFGVLSFIVTNKANPYFRAIINLYLGVCIGNGALYAINVVQNMAISRLLEGEIIYGVIPVILGIIYWLRFSTSYAYMARWPLAIVFAAGAARAFRAPVGYFHYTLTAYFNIFNPATIGSDPILALAAILVFLGSFTSTIYFIFTLKQREKTPLKQIAIMGLYFVAWFYGLGLGGFMIRFFSWIATRLQWILMNLGIIGI